MTYRLTSTCDDAGNLLAARLDNPDYTRTLETFATADDAERVRQEYLEWYATKGVQIGDGCLAVEDAIDWDAASPHLRFSEDGAISIVWCDGEALRAPTQEDVDTLPVGPDLTDDEIESLPD